MPGNDDPAPIWQGAISGCASKDEMRELIHQAPAEMRRRLKIHALTVLALRAQRPGAVTPERHFNHRPRRGTR